jgi:Tol biopolymer transport system component
MLKRLTFDTGLQSNPAWSPDGGFIAYDSDRGGNFDVWVQPVNGGDPLRVTQSPAHDWQPDWSPDGTKIVFRSERDGGGLFLVSAFGGRERKISSFGYHAKWSPSGSKLLFLSPGTRLFDYPRVYVMSVDGPAAPVEVLNSVAGDAEPVKKGFVAWYPDGERISFIADGGAFWTVPLSGGAPVRSVVDEAVARRVKEAGLDFGSFRWSPARDALYLEGVSRGVKNLWKIKVEPESLRWVDGPLRLTTGFSHDTDIALSADGAKLAYSDQSETTRAWLFPFDAQTGQVKGEGQPITDAERNAWFLDLSPDGRRLVFSTQQHGQEGQALWEKSLEDGQSRLLLQDDALRFSPRWSPDSRRLAYSLFRPPAADAPDGGPARQGPLALLDPATGEERLLTSDGPSADYMYDWSPDGLWVLGSTNRQSPDRWALALFPLSGAPRAEAGMRVLASDPEHDLWAPRFSPDGRWVCYIAQSAARPGVSVLYVMGAEGGKPTRVTESESWADKPRWSSDGKTIYFISNRGSSFLNVWGIRFDPGRGSATGEPFRVTNFERPGHALSTQLAFAEMALGRSRLLLPVTEVSGSVWVLENVGPASGRAGAAN